MRPSHSMNRMEKDASLIAIYGAILGAWSTREMMKTPGDWTTLTQDALSLAEVALETFYKKEDPGYGRKPDKTVIKQINTEDYKASLPAKPPQWDISQQ